MHTTNLASFLRVTMQQRLLNLAQDIAELALKTKLTIATAESCTGGQIAYVLTSIPGSSKWFDRGFITYSNDAKYEDLNVPREYIKQYGAVSNETAMAMAEGALLQSKANVSVATTGIAGPDGGTADKPVGLVWIAWAVIDKPVIAKRFLFKGDRASIRDLTTEQALLGLVGSISHGHKNVLELQGKTKLQDGYDYKALRKNRFED